jgi:hypothetical protein
MKTEIEREALNRMICEAGEGLYTDVKHFPNGECAWVARMAFTVAILYGFDTWGHRDRWCYDTHAAARRALTEWDGIGEPKGWHRHPSSGRRMDENGEMYVNP